jgi:hypothetical protein
LFHDDHSRFSLSNLFIPRFLHTASQLYYIITAVGLLFKIN